MARSTRTSSKVNPSMYFKYLVIMGLLAFLTYMSPSVQAALYGI